MIYIPSRVLDLECAPNFTMREVARSQTALRHGIDNTPPEDVLRNARYLAVEVLQPIRNHYGVGFSPTSWYRCPELELIVARRGFENWLKKTGYENSEGTRAEWIRRKAHPTGCAADIEVPGVANDDLFIWIKDNLAYDQLIREFPKKGDPMSGWVHVSYNHDYNKMQAFVIS